MSEILGTLFKYLMAILAVGAVVTVGYNVQQENKVSAAIADYSSLAPKIQKLYAGQGNYTGISFATVQAAGLISADWAAGVSQWGTAVTISTGTTTSQFVINLAAGVPVSACIELYSSIPAQQYYLNNVWTAGPLTVSQITTGCSGSLSNVTGLMFQ